jgi:hypothetical protein
VKNLTYQTSGPNTNPARYNEAGRTRCGPVGSGTSKATGRGGEKLEGRVEPKEVLVVERKAVRKMKALVFWSGEGC